MDSVGSPSASNDALDVMIEQFTFPSTGCFRVWQAVS